MRGVVGRHVHAALLYELVMHLAHDALPLNVDVLSHVPEGIERERPAARSRLTDLTGVEEDDRPQAEHRAVRQSSPRVSARCRCAASALHSQDGKSYEAARDHRSWLSN